MRETIIFGAWVLLFVFPSLAGAQVDSSAEVAIYCGTISDGCSYSVSWVNNVTHETMTTDGGGGISISIDDTFGFSSAIPPAQFRIDYANGLIRELHFSKFAPIYNGSQVDGQSGMIVNVDSIPFSRTTGGEIFATGRFPARWTFYSFRSGQSHQWQWDGGCQDSGITVDSVSISTFHPVSSVLDHASSSPRQDELMIETLNSSAEISFTSRFLERQFELFDELGRVRSKITVTPLLDNLRINSLPPGLYFARLSNQVTKFVVPPR